MRTIPPDQLAATLRAAGIKDVDTATRRRAEYSSDASNYRVVPTVVAFPRDAGEVEAALSACRNLGVPLVTRGAGTSIAGNAISSGVVLDTSRHMNKVLAVDPGARTATVQPGAVLDDITRAAAPHGLRFGPDPSTHSRATIGGAIGNNACGSRALAYGRTADNVIDLDVLAGSGTRFTARRYGGAAGALAASAGGPEKDLIAGLIALVSARLAVIRTEFGRFGRQVSGYSLEHLLPENGTDLARFLVGTEGSLALTLQATVRLVASPRATALAVIGYDDMARAAEAVPGLLPLKPVALEGLDARMVEVIRTRRGPGAVPGILPTGGGWLFAETAGETEQEAAAGGQRLAAAAGGLASTVVTGPAAAALWRIREDGVGLGGRTPANSPAWPGWEDSAVPPEHLPAYLRELQALLAAHQLDGLMYGHFGDGCIHVRIDFPLRDRPAVLREFTQDAARLAASHGGSASGEHGDGRSRGELLKYMYSDAARETFAQVKRLFDPAGTLNPGVIADPAPIDADLRVPQAKPVTIGLGFAYSRDGGDFATAVHRCVGVGKCRADNTGAGGVMCPSFLATRDEKDSTRGRARVLQELANGALVTGWDAPEVAQALDLCLACKGCSTDCPAGVDMATYKAEALYQRYRGRRRPAAHYTLGWLPRWARLATALPRLANAALAFGPGAALAKRAGGIDARRDLPRFARKSFRRSFGSLSAALPPAAASAPGIAPAPGVPAALSVPAGPGSTAGPGEHAAPGRLAATAGQPRPVLLWIDTFTNAFAPHVGEAAVRVLADAGYRAQVTRRQACCGLTWISTGQLDGARKQLRRALDQLGPALDAGIPIVGLEPSCLAALRDDAAELLPGDPRAAKLASAVRSLAELLRETPGWTPPDLGDVAGVAQPHCHHRASGSWEADAALLRDAGARLDAVGGCCGLAGNFGVERGHYEVSVAVAETALLPAVRAAGPGATVLADGFSCRTQLDQLAQVPGTHLAELLAGRLAARPAPAAARPGAETLA
ncbi:MAG TPA: FAD-linked oxidase C-terminal domain-containing protein [Trebonia sp.]|nr:FAD-linked oxidase C-terminal domain-containing protein [Trebonia sp.]